MFCQNCGNQIADGQKFCEHCGAPVENAVVQEVVEEVVEETVPVQEPVAEPVSSNDNWAGDEPVSYSEPTPDYQSAYAGNPYAQTEPAQGGKGLSIAAMICGILSIVCCCVGWLSIILAIVAVVLGIIAMVKGASGKALALTGLICGGVGLILAIIALAGGTAALSELGGIGGLDSLPDSITNMLNL